MQHHQIHVSDSELLMAADGELTPRRAAAVRRHLDSCWTCRERMSSLQGAITGFIRARNNELNDLIPPEAGPRALLRARLAQASQSRGNDGASLRDFVLRARAMTLRLAAAAACVFVIAGAIVLFERTVNAEGPRPNSRVTPGETRPITLAEVCRNPEAEVSVRNISAETRREVFAKYGIRPGNPGDFEVDYLITPDLGGAETVRNLWPHPYSARWNARVKDRLEQRLQDLVCANRMDRATAQREIATDWIGAYKKYVGQGSRH